MAASHVSTLLRWLTMTHYHNPAWTEESRFRGALDDVIIIPRPKAALIQSSERRTW